MEKWGIIGGTFDPIHFAHIYIAEEAKKKLNLDKIIFMIAGSPPHKKNKRVTGASLRYKMATKAIEGIKGFEVSDYEIKKQGMSYTFETLEHFEEENLELYFITGADCLIDIEKWKEVSRIFRSCKLVVFPRPGFTQNELIIQKDKIEVKYKTKIIFLEINEINQSSTMIREKIKAKEEVENLVPQSVLNIIKQENLYKE